MYYSITFKGNYIFACCRKILSDLSSEPNNLTVTKIEEESNSDQASQDSTDGTSASNDNAAACKFITT